MEKKNYDNFLKRLPDLLQKYDKLGYAYATHVYDVQAEMTPNFETNSLEVELSTIDGAPIYYTLDGKTPTAKSMKYEGKFIVKQTSELKALAIRKNGMKSKIFSEKIVVSKATFKPTTLITKTDSAYTFDGANLLVDGLFGGSSNYKTGKWIGYKKNDLVAVIDMLEPTSISKAEIRNAVVTGDWIFDASEISLESSNNDSIFTAVSSQSYVDAHKEHWSDIVTHNLTFNPVTARYFRIKVKPTMVPEWHEAKGQRGYIFVDEIKLD